MSLADPYIAADRSVVESQMSAVYGHVAVHATAVECVVLAGRGRDVAVECAVVVVVPGRGGSRRWSCDIDNVQRERLLCRLADAVLSGDLHRVRRCEVAFAGTAAFEMLGSRWWSRQTCLALQMDSQENGFDRQVQLPDSPRHGEAIEFGHVEIQNRDLRQQLPDQFETNLSVTSFRQYFQIKLMFSYLTSPLRTIG